ncbi:MAG: anti-sigma factor antagonist [Firmicutes bacterium]|nr:anti-sigma factor antagonist [Bacillota bacterium]
MDNEIKIALSGRIDSGNASSVEENIQNEIGGNKNAPVVLDASDLAYISSAGLRVILHIKKTNPDLSIINVNSEVYDIFEMTGFTDMMTIDKAYRVVSIEGCEEIGRGAKGTVYRIDKDNVVKVYNDADALEDIQHEREVAKLALVLGLPTAISYDVVRVGDSYGSVFELLNATSFSKILAEVPEKMDWVVDEYVKLLKLINGTLVPEGKLPDSKEKIMTWANYTKDYLPEELGKKLVELSEALPHDDHMVHGDYHSKNVQLQNDEILIIDMDTLAVGHPIYDLAAMYNAYVGFSEYDNNVVKEFQGFDYKTSLEFWHKTLAAYLGTDDEAKIKEVEDKARVLSYSRLIRRSIRRGGLENEKSKAEIELWEKELTELLKKVDDLYFDPPAFEAESGNELDIEAEESNLHKVLDFIDKHLDAVDCPPKVKMQIEVAVEEIFVNIASYAYAPDKGRATVRVEVSPEPITVTITFIDQGIPYDPLAKEDPDVTLKAEDRPVGGLGIFMVKQTMDDVTYEYKDGKNILRIKKSI